jgi:Glyoxalase/Bleomycin resistance protein/Dioxygenase superfamily
LGTAKSGTGRLKISREKLGLCQRRRWREVQVDVERISAVTLRVANMGSSVRFYRDVLGLEIIYGGEEAYFSSLRTKDGKDPILNLETGPAVYGMGAADFLCG